MNGTPPCRLSPAGIAALLGPQASLPEPCPPALPATRERRAPSRPEPPRDAAARSVTGLMSRPIRVTVRLAQGLPTSGIRRVSPNAARSTPARAISPSRPLLVPRQIGRGRTELADRRSAARGFRGISSAGARPAVFHGSPCPLPRTGPPCPGLCDRLTGDEQATVWPGSARSLEKEALSGRSFLPIEGG